MAAERAVINFKVDLIDKIALDAHAKAMNMSRSDFCRMAVQEKIAKHKGEKRQEPDTQKILSVLNTLNNNILELGESLGEEAKLFKRITGGFRTISRGLIVTNSDKVQELKAVFKDKEIWAKLAEEGFKYG